MVPNIFFVSKTLTFAFEMKDNTILFRKAWHHSASIQKTKSLEKSAIYNTFEKIRLKCWSMIIDHQWTFPFFLIQKIISIIHPLQNFFFFFKKHANYSPIKKQKLQLISKNMSIIHPFEKTTIDFKKYVNWSFFLWSLIFTLREGNYSDIRIYKSKRYRYKNNREPGIKGKNRGWGAPLLL